MTVRNGPLLLCGASVRAAAWSARRAGIDEVIAVDLFADADLLLNCETHRVSSRDYPEGLALESEKLRIGPAMVTGALENYPLVVQRLGRNRILWGNGPDALRAVRDPFLLTQSLADHGLPHPRVTREPAGESRDWLVKRRRSSAGMGVCPWQGEPAPPDSYLQEFIPGLPHAAIYCGFADGNCSLLGVTRQLIGAEWLRAGPFHYCGSVGPVRIGAGEETLARIGLILTNQFGLRGLFGVDFILKENLPYPVEVNPRYTASIEILERATNLKSIAYQRAAFEESEPPPLDRACKTCSAKGILFANRDLALPKKGPWLADLRSWIERPLPDYADIPDAGSPIARGQPILTLFAQGESAELCEASLREKVRETEGWLYP